MALNIISGVTHAKIPYRVYPESLRNADEKSYPSDAE